MLEFGLHLMDCMAGMKQFPDKFFELALVDPPYGIGDKKLTSGGTWAAKYKAGDCAWDVAPDAAYFTELFRVSKHQVVWGANYFGLGPTRGFIVWDKNDRMPTMADCEYAWTSMDRNAKIFTHPRNTNEPRIHVTQKPIALYRWILSNYAHPGDKILDTHVGSASSLIACHEMGFQYVGFEIDPDYYTAATKRIDRAKAQVSMFTAQNPAPEQCSILDG